MNQLNQIDRVSIRQKTTIVANNKYVVIDPNGQLLFYAHEDSSTMSRIFVGKDRAFHINLFDSQNQCVISFRRPYTFGPDKMEVSVGGQVVSIVRQEITFFKPVLRVFDAQERPVFKIKGPIGSMGTCDYDIFTPNKQQIGVIRKKWSGTMREMFTDSDNFEIVFPKDLDVRFKAALLGACYLIDFLYYEN